MGFQDLSSPRQREHAPQVRSYPHTVPLSSFTRPPFSLSVHPTAPDVLHVFLSAGDLPSSEGTLLKSRNLARVLHGASPWGRNHVKITEVSNEYLLNEGMGGSTAERKQVHFKKNKHLKARTDTTQGREFRAGPEICFQRLSGLHGHRLAEQRAWGHLIAPSDRKEIRGTSGSNLHRRYPEAWPWGRPPQRAHSPSSANPQRSAFPRRSGLGRAGKWGEAEGGLGPGPPLGERSSSFRWRTDTRGAGAHGLPQPGAPGCG